MQKPVKNRSKALKPNSAARVRVRHPNQRKEQIRSIRGPRHEVGALPERAAQLATVAAGAPKLTAFSRPCRFICPPPPCRLRLDSLGCFWVVEALQPGTGRRKGIVVSKRSDFSAELRGLSRDLGGSHLTQQARDSALQRFAGHCWDSGFQLANVSQVKVKHIRAFIEARQAAGVSARTLQNDVSHIRQALERAGRGQFVAEQLGSRQLGLEQASRAGTKAAISPEAYDAAVKAAESKDRGVAACLRLCHDLGLRSAEAVQAGKSLRDWKAALERGGSLVVTDGTKGGRVRTIPADLIPDQRRALESIREALAISEAGKGPLIASEGLKGALDRFHNVARSCGLTGANAPHSLRYRFAVDVLQACADRGLSRERALVVASELLGHGDGRGKWVDLVYSRK